MVSAVAAAQLVAAIRRLKRAEGLLKQVIRELKRAADGAQVIGHVRVTSPVERDRALDLVRIAADGNQEVDVIVLSPSRPH